MTQTVRFPVDPRAIAATWLLAAVLLAVATTAGAEARTPVVTVPAPTARIGPDALSPAVLRVGEGGEFAIANRSTALARIEFRIGRGERLECRSDRGALSGRKFVIENGEVLRCAAPGGAMDYSVFRNLRVEGGRFRTLRSEGRVED
jgi:hypothetical protein